CMSSRDPAVEAWARKAENDRKNIRASLQSGDPAWDTVCYHAQQAAEKYLKAFLVANRVAPPHVHDLEQLLNLCLDLDPTLDELAADCALLTDYAVDVRYPEVTEPDATTGQAAVAAAERVCEAIRRRLPPP
ncbi:MAG: HEPN domain-containing protein, partial [Verrucomicrobiae bacterium]|nr:HEPN domain-containing protein [Verrucomicrobiae bacterium]